MTYAGPESPRAVLDDLNLEVAASEFVCLVGPSGVGKTTLLRCLSGLQRPTHGEVRVGGGLVVEPPAALSVVFQDYSRSLFPWMSVVDNVALPLRAQGVKRAKRLARAAEMLDEVGLADVRKQYPWQLSGGMQQRVAIARALVDAPQMLLMDEPFASVDAQTRFDLEDLALTIRRDTGVSILLVTHDIDESVYLGDRIVVLSGRPASVATILDVPFGHRRDQIRTRADPRFAEIRTEVLVRIQGAGESEAAPASAANLDLVG
nr:ABC transporter ATP-binding protein [Patulibacter medicamentivorans]